MFFFSFIYRTNISRKKIFIAVFIAIIIVVGIVTALSFSLKDDDKPNFRHLRGAVAANGEECAEIGASILRKRGSVADAAIATMLCEGVTCKFFVFLLCQILSKITCFVQARNRLDLAVAST